RLFVDLADLDDLAVADTDVGLTSGCTGTVDDGAAADDAVEHPFLLARLALRVVNGLAPLGLCARTRLALAQCRLSLRVLCRAARAALRAGRALARRGRGGRAAPRLLSAGTGLADHEPIVGLENAAHHGPADGVARGVARQHERHDLGSVRVDDRRQDL